jgi:hypothetical protein
VQLPKSSAQLQRRQLAMVVLLDQSGDEELDQGDVLNFSDVMDEAEGQMETSLDDSSVMEDSMLSDIKEVPFPVLESSCTCM